MIAIFVCCRRSEKPCAFCNRMVASPLAAAVVTTIMRCEFCAAQVMIFLRIRFFTCMLSTFGPPMVWVISLDFCKNCPGRWQTGSVGFGKRGLLEKGSFQKSPFSRDSRDFRDPPDCEKQRRIRPLSRYSREF